MPWLREPALNLLLIFQDVDPEMKVIPEFQMKLRETIREKGWTLDGMHRIELKQNRN